jgi:hypothetical protein
VVRVYEPALFGMSRRPVTVDFARIRSIDADAAGCVRVRTLEGTVDVVDKNHPCRREDANVLAGRIHELVFGAKMPDDDDDA